MRFEMELQVKFNRPVDLEKDNIIPGGYEMVMNGKNVSFDFSNTSAGVSNEDAAVVIFSVDGMDCDSFPEMKKLKVCDIQNISSINECVIYTGEPGESDLEVVSIEKVTFILPNNKPWIIDIPKKLIDEYNSTLHKDEQKEHSVYEIKMTPSELKEKIMAQQMTFYSKFLDIPLEDLCGYTNEQLESMIDSTIEQMPDDLLHQFEIELMGGKREF